MSSASSNPLFPARATGADGSLLLPTLPYPHNALEPVLSQKLLELHHLKHHQTYTTKLNEAFNALKAAGQGEVVAQGVDRLLTNLSSITDPALQKAVRNHGGGFVNHDLFWRVLGPVKADSSIEKDAPTLSAKINSTFGSFAAFQQKFDASALGVFGSGWVWLYVDGTNGSLVISQSANQDTPLNEGKGHAPILTIDVWEHAYYVDYFNRRDEFIKAFWKIVNWSAVEALFVAAQAK